MKRVNRFPELLASLLAVSILNIAGALSPPPPLPVDELAEFYHAMDGDNWHRNEGWLDTEVDVCDWYGITCVTEAPQFGGFRWVGHLRLADNNLSGELTAELVELLIGTAGTPVPSRQLDLSGNRITGELPVLPLAIPAVDLADNALTGPLPEGPDGDESALEELDLSGNVFAGSIPESWSDLELRQLRLSRNALEGSIEPALAALTLHEPIHLDVAGNQFSGPLPESLMALDPFALDGSRTGSLSDGWQAAFPAGLNLCWNDFDPTEGELALFISQHHHGGGLADCQRPQAPIDPTVSGSWFNPDRNGEGFVQQLLDNGRMLMFWFTYARDENAGQRWFLGLEPASETGVWMENLLAPVGQFGAGNREPETPREELDLAIPFRLSINRLDEKEQHIAYSRSVVLGGSATGLVSFGLDSLRYDQVALTQLAGTTCENQSNFQQYSGAWYNPERSGEGFFIEVLPDEEAVVYWFTYKPDDSGEQAWMVGQGQISKPHSVVLSPVFPPEVSMDLYQPVGTAFGAGFDPDEIELLEWGQIHFEFHPPNSGTVEWESNREGYGSGEYPIKRLTQPMLAECEE